MMQEAISIIPCRRQYPVGCRNKFGMAFSWVTPYSPPYLPLRCRRWLNRASQKSLSWL